MTKILLCGQLSQPSRSDDRAGKRLDFVEIHNQPHLSDAGELPALIAKHQPTMRLTRLIPLLLSASLLLSLPACTINVYPDAPTHLPRKSNLWLKLHKIDNRLIVFVKDKGNTVIFDSGEVHYNPNLDLSINLAHLLKKGTHTLVFQLHNTPWQGGSGWEVHYDLLINGRAVESVHESSGGVTQQTGVVFTREHVVRVD